MRPCLLCRLAGGWYPEVVTLGKIAAEGAQLGRLLGGLHALSHHLEAEGARERSILR